MRTIFVICGLLLVGGGVVAWRVLRMPDEFGAFQGAPLTAAADLVERPKEFLGKPVQVEGTVSEQCQSMGCYFFIRTPKGDLRVDLEEIAMHAPKREGRPARVEGQMVPRGDGFQLFATAVRFQ